jgi:hypothetical protein
MCQPLGWLEIGCFAWLRLLLGKVRWALMVGAFRR